MNNFDQINISSYKTHINRISLMLLLGKPLGSLFVINTGYQEAAVN